MNVYLDNNVFVDIEMGALTEEQFLSIPNSNYYYSDAHIGELLEAIDNPRVSQEGRLSLLSRICGKKEILTGCLEKPEFFERKVTEVYRVSKLIPFQRIINQMAENGYDVYMKIRSQLGFDSTIFNNENKEKVLVIIDKKMKEKLGIGLLPYLQSTEAFGGKPLYYTLINIINAANYWGDKKTEHSEIARVFDASHAYFAQICDLLVTNDKRMRAKTKAVYSFLGVKTHVVSVEEYFHYSNR